MSEDFILNEKEFNELDEKEKWDYISFLLKKIKELTVKAELNCSECEKNFITNEDINVDLFFEDWRNCKDDCENCGREQQVTMCELQFNIMNHIAEELHQLKNKFNAIVKSVLTKEESGKKLISSIEKSLNETDKNAGNMFL